MVTSTGMIVLEQHWYGSAPVGLELSRGFQTLAQSKGLTDVRSLKAHCAYKRPPGTRDGSTPVNWGWFHLEDGRACIHRIGYAGTDELGRPGNFLAHNFVVRLEQLQDIDYDIPCLLHWIRKHPDGQREGFTCNYRQLYAMLDPDKKVPDKNKLEQAPALEVPVEEVRRIREEVDRDWKGHFLDSLHRQLGGDVLKALLQVFLCPPAERRPLVLVGPGEGTAASELGLQVVDFLFAILPSYCRRQLTFSTYEHDIPSLFATSGPDLSAGRRNRRLLMTTTANDVRMLGARADNLIWLCHPSKSQIVTPPASPLAIRECAWLEQEIFHQAALKFRSQADWYVPEDEWQGLNDAQALHELISDLPRKSRQHEDYELFIRLAALNRTGKSHLLELGQQLMKEGERVQGWTIELMKRFSESYVGLLRVLNISAGIPEDGSDSEGHFEYLDKLLTFLLVHIAAHKDEGAMQAALHPAVDLALLWYPTLDKRLEFFSRVTKKVVSWNTNLRNQSNGSSIHDLSRVFRECNVEQGEAIWHATHLKEAILHPDAPEDWERRTTVRALLKAPYLADSASQRTSFALQFSKYVNNDVRKQIAQRLISDCRGNRNIDEKARQWLTAEGKYNPLLHWLRQEPELLESVGRDLVKIYGSATNPSFEALGQLVSWDLPKSVRGRIYKRLVELLREKLQELQRKNEEPRDGFEWIIEPSQARLGLELCGPMTTVGRELPQFLQSFWAYLARCLSAVASHESIVRAYLSRIILFGETYKEFFKATLTELLATFFATINKTVGESPETRAYLFVLAGESLIAANHLREAKELVRDHQKGIWRSYLGNGHSIEDTLHDALCRIPSVAKDGVLETEEACASITSRAHLAALFFCAPNHLPRLAEIYVKLGSPVNPLISPVFGSPRITALAIHTFLTLEGTDEEGLSKQTDTLLQPRFWKAFHYLTKSKGENLCNELLSWWQKRCRLTEDEAMERVRPFSEKYKTEK